MLGTSSGPDTLLLPLLPLRSWSWDLDAFLAAGLEVGVVQATCASCSRTVACHFSCLEGSLAKTPWESRWDPRDGSSAMAAMTPFQPTAKAMESGMGLHSAAIALAVTEGLGDLCSRQLGWVRPGLGGVV